ncbi:hypothetical protein BSKO_04935 [Bryopsis sp. KO-2023]|nr:hypothetical protein BSKO_04935 [Bryopsis sp. KO-2023]
MNASLTTKQGVVGVVAQKVAVPATCRCNLRRGARGLAGVRFSQDQRPCVGSRIVVASAASDTATAPVSVPVPVVKIDNIHDPFATLVTVQFGEELGDLVDTIQALKNLGLNIKRAKLNPADPESKHKFYVTDASTSEKIVKSERLEKIRFTILGNLTKFHPESIDQLGVAHPVNLPQSRDATEPLGPRHRVVVDTTIDIEEHASGCYTELFVTTLDRPGLLVDIVSVLKDLNVNVVSAEVDTVGTQAQDEFFVTYHGEALSVSMKKLVENCLQYYLSLQEVESEESY